MPTTNYAYDPAFNPATYVPVFDPTGTLPANLVSNERHTITAANGRDFHFIVPIFGPFFGYPGALSIVFTPLVGPPRTLVEGIDYVKAFQFIGASRGCSKPVYGGISFLNNQLAGEMRIGYRSIGGNWTISLAAIQEILSNTLTNPRVTAWEQVIDSPATFPVIDHEWNLVDLVGASEIVAEIHNVSLAIANRPAPIIQLGLQEHINDFNNPHQVTKAQVGLSLVSNFRVATSAETIAGTSNILYVTPQGVRAALDVFAENANNELAAHLEDEANPHNTTKGQVGLSNVQNFPVATDPEAAAAVSNSAYMTPLRTKTEVAALLAGNTLPANLTEVVASTQFESKGRVVAAMGALMTSGFSFGGGNDFDSGMFSATTGKVDFYADSVKYYSIYGSITEFNSFVIGATLSMPMVVGNFSRGSFTARATGTGDANLAGMSFVNDAYGIKLGVRADGYFGLGGWNRAAWSWYSDPSGNMVAAGDVTAYSDPRLKENIEQITNATESLMQLNGVRFTWKDIEHVAIKAGKRDIGILANEVEALFPEMVTESIEIEGKKYKTVAYQKLIPVLIEGFKELATRLDAAEKEIAALRG